MKTIQLCSHLHIDSDFMDMCWADDRLYVYSPERGILKRYLSTTYGMSVDDQFALDMFEGIRLDWKGKIFLTQL
jgi:hypothetical protein